MATTSIADARTSTPRPDPALRAVPLLAGAVATLAAVSFIAGVITPVPGGGMCTGSCVAWPFDDWALVRDFVPVSFYWMLPAMAMLITLVAFVASLGAPQRQTARLPTTLAMGFTVMGAGILVADYGIQLAVVWPSLVHGQGESVAALSLFNPHGLFVALEDIGYWILGFGFLGIAAALPSETRTERWARWLFRLGGLVAVSVLPAVALALGPDLGFVYEILVITVVYLTLVSAGACLAVGSLRSAQRLGGGAHATRPAQRPSR